MYREMYRNCTGNVPEKYNQTVLRNLSSALFRRAAAPRAPYGEVGVNLRNESLRLRNVRLRLRNVDFRGRGAGGTDSADDWLDGPGIRTAATYGERACVLNWEMSVLNWEMTV